MAFLFDLMSVGTAIAFITFTDNDREGVTVYNDVLLKGVSYRPKVIVESLMFNKREG